MHTEVTRPPVSSSDLRITEWVCVGAMKQEMVYIGWQVYPTRYLSVMGGWVKGLCFGKMHYISSKKIQIGSSQQNELMLTGSLIMKLNNESSSS